MSQAEAESKSITGYCEPWSLRAGDAIKLRASSHTPGPAEVSLVRIHCGDPTKAGPGFSESAVTDVAASTIELSEQELRPGSYATIDLTGLEAQHALELEVSVMLTLPDEPQTILELESASGDTAFRLAADAGVLRAQASGLDLTLRDQPLAAQRWYRLHISVDLAAGTISTSIATNRSASPGRDLFESKATAAAGGFPLGSIPLGRLLLAGTRTGADSLATGDFDGRIGEPQLRIDEHTLVWDLYKQMHSPTIVEHSQLARHGTLHQLPTRAVTGPAWDGSEQRWSAAPEQWNAVHFHKDDLYDAGWQESISVQLPDELPSGIYAFKVEQGDQVDRVPFFVRPALDAPTNDVALLMSSATYLAYANHRMLFEGADFIGTRSRLRPEHDYVRHHPELGRSMYEKHPDGSGVMFSSRLRPVLNLRPGADGWNFTPDTDINAFLENSGVGHDVISDDDVHTEGFTALAPYRVVVTCSHPEYWSTAMLDALSQWQREGGRLMYLGGNGFYWRVAFSDAWPGAMELRRAEDGVRNWQPGDGENYHAFGGEYGGMWRRNGRAPNELVGVGFAAQGFGRATYFDVNEASVDSRAGWIWDGVHVEDGKIGISGLGGGAAGQEIDRYDPQLGSPNHAVVLASATAFGPDMLRTKEEFEASVDTPSPDPYVRADIVFYEPPNGGAVFSASSISWFGALARNAYDNDVAKMTRNVLYRFADPAPFPLPDQEPAS